MNAPNGWAIAGLSPDQEAQVNRLLQLTLAARSDAMRAKAALHQAEKLYAESAAELAKAVGTSIAETLVAKGARNGR